MRMMKARRIGSGLNERDVRQLLFCLAVTFIIGLTANGVILSDLVLSHDSLVEFVVNSGVATHQISLGRYFGPAYANLVRGGVSLPWLIGILAFLYIGLSVYLTVRMFGIESKTGMALIAGVFTANITVTALAATYIGYLDVDLLGLLFAVLAAYCWHKDTWAARGVACVCGMICLALYQSFISVTIGLMMISVIIDLTENKDLRGTIRKGLMGIAVLACSGVLYYIGLQIAVNIAGTTVMKGYNGLGNMEDINASTFFPRIGLAYKSFFNWLTEGYTAYTAELFKVCNIALGVIGIVLLIATAIKNKTKPLAMLTIVALLVLLPFGLNISTFLCGISHTLMYYAFALVYIPFIIAMTRDISGDSKSNEKDMEVVNKHIDFKTIIKGVACMLVGLVIWGNIQTAVCVDTEKKMQQDITLSYMTNLSHDMNNIEGYVPGETPVIITGGFDLVTGGSYFGIHNIVGTGKFAMTYDDTYPYYFRYILGTPIVTQRLEEVNKMSQESIIKVIEMPVYPAAGSIQMLEGKLIVKTGEVGTSN